VASLILYSVPLVLHAFVAKWKNKTGWHDIAQRLGLAIGKKPDYWWA
jgi:hypothetical protein